MENERDLIDEQIEYYQRRAPEYDETSRPPGDFLAPYGRQIEAALEAFRPDGHVLEIACGTGWWTERLLRHAGRVTAIDSSPEMIRLARERIRDDDRVEFVVADVFRWTPDHEFDVVCFANWLSHVPLSLFEEFWRIVDRALAPRGRVFVADEIEDAWRHDLPEEFVEDPSVPLVRRTLIDGRTYRVIKVLWNPAELEARLHDIGWNARVHPIGPFFWAETTRS
jgi:ubiquinone/menaquinone biosynthesis C-methylase UbiE